MQSVTALSPVALHEATARCVVESAHVLGLATADYMSMSPDAMPKSDGEPLVTLKYIAARCSGVLDVAVGAFNKQVEKLAATALASGAPYKLHCNKLALTLESLGWRITMAFGATEGADADVAACNGAARAIGLLMRHGDLNDELLKDVVLRLAAALEGRVVYAEAEPADCGVLEAGPQMPPTPQAVRAALKEGLITANQVIRYCTSLWMPLCLAHSCSISHTPPCVMCAAMRMQQRVRLPPLGHRLRVLRR